MTKRFRIGVISSVHGIHGECKVFVTSDSPERFKKLKTVRAVRPKDPLSGAKGGEETELELVSVRFFNNMAICRFRGIDTPEHIRTEFALIHFLYDIHGEFRSQFLFETYLPYFTLELLRTLVDLPFDFVGGLLRIRQFLL